MYVGRRINPPNPNERTGPGALEVYASSTDYYKNLCGSQFCFITACSYIS